MSILLTLKDENGVVAHVSWLAWRTITSLETCATRFAIFKEASRAVSHKRLLTLNGKGKKGKDSFHASRIPFPLTLYPKARCPTKEGEF